MAISSPFSLFILTIFIFIFIFSTFSITEATHDPSLIPKTCKKIAYENPNVSFNFCSTSLRAATAKRSRCADLRGLGLVAIGLVRRNLTSTRRGVRKLMRNKQRLDPFVKSCLADCLELYSDAIPTLKQARRDYKEKRYADANSEISSVMDAPTTCEDGFKEKKGVVSPLTKRNGDAFELAAIALAIMSMLH